MHDLAIIVVSHNSARWLSPALTSVYEHTGSASVDVVVADNESTDGTCELVAREFPEVRILECVNRGFAHANNQAWLTCDARYALFLNPDTEILDGTFDELVDAMDARPEVGLAGVRQVTPDGKLFPTIRRSPNALRALMEALGSERFPVHASWLGERELRMEQYDHEVTCDWTSGSFMVVRREALLAAGLMDERFFLYCEEPDLCLRIRRAGWDVRHLPVMTILHHAETESRDARLLAQETYSKLLYVKKHFAPPHRPAYRAALALRYALRQVGARGEENQARRHAAATALAVTLGRAAPPFGEPPRTAFAGRAPDTPVRS